MGPVHPWGLLVAIAIFGGHALAMRRAKRAGYDMREFNAFVVWGLVTGFVFGHWIDLVFYHPGVLLSRPYSMLFLWESQSSTGGMLGAVVGALIWSKLDVRREGGKLQIRRRPNALPLMPFADEVVALYPFGFGLGRLGCALVHDHPGKVVPYGSFLSVAWPVPTEPAEVSAYGPLTIVWGPEARYDLGLLELGAIAIMFVAVAMVSRKRRPVGTYTALLAIAYAPVRFGLDFLRRIDGPDPELRHAGLTYAQWMMLVLLGFGIWVALRLRARGGYAVPDILRSAADRGESSETRAGEGPSGGAPAREMSAHESGPA